MELRAELTGRDGLKRPVRVRCEPEGSLRGLLSGLVQLRKQVTALLDPLVQQESESGGGDRAAGSGGDEDEQDEDEEENHVNAKACPVGPPLKRKKTSS